MQTLLLDTAAWDLVIDLNNNIAMASDPYSLAQDAASAIKLFLGELYYDTTQGVPYNTILGQLPSLAYLKAQLAAAAMTVPNVSAANVFISSFVRRTVSGQVQIIDPKGLPAVAVFQT
jgi:hypothetical protein